MKHLKLFEDIDWNEDWEEEDEEENQHYDDKTLEAETDLIEEFLKKMETDYDNFTWDGIILVISSPTQLQRIHKDKLSKYIPELKN